MEVHHHSHAAHGKKKWTHYFWEFLMLFLAVTLGFFVENKREHYIEHIRAREFARSLIQDLNKDTSAINTHTKSAQKFMAFTDSLLYLYQHTQLQGQDAIRFSIYTRFMYWTIPINWNRATFEQIKNSGGLRYFKNYQLLEKIMGYDAVVKELEAEFSNHQARANTLVLTKINEILDPVSHHSLSKYSIWELDTIPREKLEMLMPVKGLSYDSKKEKIIEFLNICVVQQRNLRININRRWPSAKKLADELITELKKEYKLK